MCISVCVKAAGCSREEKKGEEEGQKRDKTPRWGKKGRGSTYEQQREDRRRSG